MKKAKPGYKFFKLTKHGKVILSLIPEKWDIITLGGISVPITKGTTPTTDGDGYTDDGVLFIKVENILKNGKLNDSNKSFISKNTHQKFKRSQLKENDIIFSIAGSLGRLARIRKEHLPANVNQAIAIIRIKDNNFKYGFLEYFLQSTAVLKQILIEKTIMAQPNLSLTQMSNLKIIKPSSNEQEKITLILSNIDYLINHYEQIIRLTKLLKQGLMQSLLTKGIGHKKFKTVKWFYGKEIKIPEKWEIKFMKDISKVRQGLQIPISERYGESGKNRLQYITVKSIHSNNFEEFIEDAGKRVICNNDDILFTRTGNTGEIVTNIKGVFHNNFFLIDYQRDQMDKNYLIYFLKQKKIQSIIKSLSGSTTIPDLNHGDFYRLLIPLPSKIEQQQITSMLSAVDSKIFRLTSNKTNLDHLKKGLMQKLLTGQIRVKI